MDGPLLSAPRLQRVRVKGNEMRGKGGRARGANGGGECGRRRTTPGEDTFHSSVSVAEHTHKRPEHLGSGAHPVLALTCVLADVLYSRPTPK